MNIAVSDNDISQGCRCVPGLVSKRSTHRGHVINAGLIYYQFCDGCGKPTLLKACSYSECHIGLCCGDGLRTGCLQLSEVQGQSWFCPNHNKPLKVKVGLLTAT